MLRFHGRWSVPAAAVGWCWGVFGCRGSASGGCRVVGCFAVLFGRVLLAAVVEVGGEGGDGFGTWFGVAAEGAEVTVAAFGLEQHCGRAGFAEVGEGGVAELVEGPPAAGFPQRCACAFVGEAPSAGVGASVTGGGYDVGLVQSDEYWSSATASDVAGEQPCGARRPKDHFPVASLADNRSPFAGSVEVLDV